MTDQCARDEYFDSNTGLCSKCVDACSQSTEACPPACTGQYLCCLLFIFTHDSTYC